jgi:L-asparagine transporter-like permease
MNPASVHTIAIATAILGVAAQNFATRRPGRVAYWFAMLMTVAFALACFVEVGWMGLFLAFMSPNVTDILNSLAKNGGSKC